MDETLIRSLIFVAMITAAWLVIKALRGLWRAVRGVNVETVARAAGALTGAAQDRAARAAQAFKDGRLGR